MFIVLSNNHPSITPHQLKHEHKTTEVHSYIFVFGDISNKNSFREEIRLNLYNDDSVEYIYSWGLPNGEFAQRSGAKMIPQQ